MLGVWLVKAAIEMGESCAVTCVCGGTAADHAISFLQ